MGRRSLSLSAIMNALKIVGKKIGEITAVVNGCGAAGTAIAKLLLGTGLKNVILCDKQGVVYEGCPWLNPMQAEIAKVSNRGMIKGTLADALAGADVFIGVSAPEVLKPEMIAAMADDPIIFAMANPVPEIMPDAAKAAGARVVGTGRSDFANQINNVLAFPGIFRGALDVRASDINNEMKIAAARAIASIITDEELSEDYIIPNSLDSRVVEAVAAAVAQAARDTGVARV